jgi:hypothetical protein
MRQKTTTLWVALGLTGMLLLPKASAQITNTVFFEDFSSGLDPGKLVVSNPPFEGGKGDIAPTVVNGVVEFAGTVSEQWWPGATLKIVPTFNASAETNIVVSVDRVLEYGEGTASRSALWIFDTTLGKYVLFADVRGEEGWRYNRKIGVSGDVPTGGGTILTAFDGGSYDDGGQHQMKVVSNGRTLKLYLDGKYGAEVQFPFTTLIFQIGSYARANGDTAGTTFDNLKVEAVGTITLSLSTLTLGVGQTNNSLSVRIPEGANATSPVTVRIISSRPAVANPVGATAGSLSLTFEAGGPNTKTFGLEALSLGGARITVTNTVGLIVGNSMDVTVIKGPGVVLEETFAGAALDTTKWQVSNKPFETATGTYEVKQEDGVLKISGTTAEQYWAGASIKTVADFTATKDLALLVEVDRVSIDPLRQLDLVNSSGARTGVFLGTYTAAGDRDAFIFFGQDLGETGWEVNLNPGNPTGSGTSLAAFDSLDAETNQHRLKLYADGTKAEVFLNGVSGGQFDFPLQVGLYLEVGAYARDYDDMVTGIFDNVKISYVLPNITASPPDLSVIQGETGNFFTITIPRLLNSAADAMVTVTSSDPKVAIPEGAVNGVLTLTFPAGKTNVQTVKVVPLSAGLATFMLANNQGAGIGNHVSVSVTPTPTVILSDDFAAPTLDSSKWKTDNTPLIDTGVATAESGVFLTNSMVNISITGEVLGWPGSAVYTVASYPATATAPAVFEIDRVKMEYRQITGDVAKERTGVWIRDSSTNYVFFSELGSWNATPAGWQYHRVIGRTNDNRITQDDAGGGTYLTAFNAAKFTDLKNHHIKVVANGTSVKLYLDGEFGADVPFPFSPVTFGFSAYVRDATDPVGGYYDNAVVLGYPAAPPTPGPLAVARQANGDVVISWTGSGTLQSAATLPGTWTDVSPPPSGTTYTIPKAAQGQQQYYRLRQ